MSSLTNAFILNPCRRQDFGVELDKWMQFVFVGEVLEILLDFWRIRIET